MSEENDEQNVDQHLDAFGGPVEVHVESGDLGDGQFHSLEIPAELPILPLKNTVLFPFLLSPLLVSTSASQKLIDDVLLRPDRLLVCAALQNEIAAIERGVVKQILIDAFLDVFTSYGRAIWSKSHF